LIVEFKKKAVVELRRRNLAAEENRRFVGRLRKKWKRK